MEDNISSGTDTTYRRSGTFSADLEPLRFNARGRVLINDVTNFDREQFERYLVRPAYVKVLQRGSDSDSHPFSRLFLAQEMKLHPVAITVSGFSPDGKFFCTGGKDGSIKVLKVLESTLEKLSLSDLECELTGQRQIQYAPLFNELDILELSVSGSQSEVLDVSWSKNNFLLSSSMDRAVKLWAPLNSDSPVMEFLHPDFVTSAKFIDLDDRFFVSGCLDHHVRLWSITENKIQSQYDCGDPITVISLSPRGGGLTVVGTFTGYIYVLSTPALKLIHRFHVKAIASAFDGSEDHDSIQITGIDWVTEDEDRDQRVEDNCYSVSRVVVTCSDARIRLFKLSERARHVELHGFRIEHYRHRAHLFTWNHKPFIYCSSEDQWLYVWRLDPHELGFSNSHSHSQSVAVAVGADTHSKKKRHFSRPHSLSFHAHDHPLTTVSIAPRTTLKMVSQSNDFIYEFTTRCHFSRSGYYIAVDDTDADADVDGKDVDGEDGEDVALQEEEQLLPPDDIIGPILVTTDSSGSLRVFRIDLHDTTRDTLLHVFHTAINTGTPTL